jgi:hypothetical protein
MEELGKGLHRRREVEFAKRRGAAPVLLAHDGAETVQAVEVALASRRGEIRRRQSDTATRSAMQRLIDRHGESVLAYITRAYGLPWPAEGYPIHYSGYTNWAGAYSTAGNLLVVSSLSTISGTLAGMEILFHEAMHQWDDTVFKLLRVHTRALGALVPNNLTHAMIFLTAGEAVRSVVPDHVPYAEIAGIWNRGMQPFRAPLIETWKPWLDGAGSRDDAMAALMLRTVDRRPPG